jgi:hypothetical protein
VCHHQKVGAILRTNIVKRADVEVVQARYGLGLALQPLFGFGALRTMRGENLDRDRALETSIEGAIDFTPSACAEGRLDLVGAGFAPQI